jgi:CubicO group peptidase (beta-lactamase class C family)
LLVALAIAAPLHAQSPDSVMRLLERHTLPGVRITGEPSAGAPLAARLAHYHTPAVSVAVIDSGRIVWARAWGLADRKSGRAATPQTLFQAASISKPVTATAALSLVEEGRLSLDADVNPFLKSWQVPASEHQHGQAVTLRRLLTHTAGLTIHGFPGYARSAQLLTAVQVLRGEGNTKPVVIDTTPGSRWNYSGGGYTVVQVMLSDVTGLPFATFMQQRVLGPMHMTLSTYQQPLPQDRWGEAATGYRVSGEAVEQDWHVYPEQAAAGLWTTPTDLARWGLGILAAYDGRTGGVLSPTMAKQMLTAGLGNYGLGAGLYPEFQAFGHGGANEGFRCQITVFFDGKGVVVMTNSDAGGNVIREVLTTLATAYGWPAFKPVEKSLANWPKAKVDEVAGRYRMPDDTDTVVVTVEGGRLYLAHPAFGKVELLPQSDSSLFLRDDGTDFTVVREHGRVVGLTARGQQARRLAP